MPEATDTNIEPQQPPRDDTRATVATAPRSPWTTFPGQLVLGATIVTTLLTFSLLINKLVFPIFGILPVVLWVYTTWLWAGLTIVGMILAAAKPGRAGPLVVGALNLAVLVGAWLWYLTAYI